MSTPQTPSSARPARGAEIDLDVERLAHGGNGVARLDGYVVFVAGAIPGDRVRAQVTKSKRAYAEARAVEVLEPSPDRIEPVADHPGAPWQVLPYERQLEVKHEQVDDALARIGRLEGFELEPIVRRRRDLALPQQARVLVRHRRRRRARVRLPRPRALRPHLAARGLQARLRARQRRARAGAGVVPRARPARRGTGATQRGLLRNLVVREGRRTGQIQVRLVTSPGEIPAGELADAVDCEGLFWTRTAGPRREHPRRRDRAAGRRAAAARAPRRPQLPDLARGVLPDQHRDGRGALRRRRRARGPARARARLRPLLRHRHDRRCRSPPARARSRAWRSSRTAVADAIENARLNEITNASFYAGDIRLAMRDLVEQAGPPGRLRHRPAARGPVGRRSSAA